MNKTKLITSFILLILFAGFKNPEQLALIDIDFNYRNGYTGYLKSFERAEKLFQARQLEQAANQFLIIGYGETTTIEGRWPIQNVALLRAAECFNFANKTSEATKCLRELLTSNVSDEVGGFYAGESPIKLRIAAEGLMSHWGQSPKQFYRSLIKTDTTYYQIRGIHSLSRFNDVESIPLLKKIKSDTSIFQRVVITFRSSKDTGLMDRKIWDAISRITSEDTTIKSTVFISRDKIPTEGVFAIAKDYYLRRAAAETLQHMDVLEKNIWSTSEYGFDDYFEIEKWILK